jgi:hypothetical protein
MKLHRLDMNKPTKVAGAVPRSSGRTEAQAVPDVTRATEIPRDRSGRWLAGCGVAGPILLALYFGVPALVPHLGSLTYNGGTPSTGRIVAVGADYHLLLSIGGWLQGTGALLCVVFLLALAHWSGNGSGLPARILVLGCAVLVGLVLAEMLFTSTWASAAVQGESSSARAAYDLMARFAQVFPIVAAPIYIALAAVLCTGRPVLPAIFTRLAAVLGLGFFLIGLVAVFAPGAGAVTGGLSGLWLLAAGIAALRSSTSRPLRPNGRVAETQPGRSAFSPPGPTLLGAGPCRPKS